MGAHALQLPESRPRPEAPARVFLARHCSTDWNVQGRLQGSQDLPLNDQGRAEALALVALLEPLGLQRIYSSPYQRAWQTGRIYAEHLGIPLEAHPGLRELDHGVWEGAIIDDLLSSNASGYAGWLVDASRVAVPGGEAIDEAQKRVANAFVDIVVNGGLGPVLIVTHKHIRALLLCALQGLDLSAFGAQIIDSQAPSEVPSYQIEALLARIAGLAHTSL
ncbi:MAG: histidine phosphatase family protein [Chromatiaceae bacterium]|nr:histidine phosphatase family protein [Chromatiaceae bacterium]